MRVIRLSKALLILCTIATFLALTTLLLLITLRKSNSTSVSATVDGAALHFSVDQSWLAATGDCTVISWTVEGIKEVYLNGEGRVGSGAEKICITSTENDSPTFDIVFANDSRRVYRLPVKILFYDTASVFLLFTAALLLVLGMGLPVLFSDHSFWTTDLARLSAGTGLALTVIVLVFSILTLSLLEGLESTFEQNPLGTILVIASIPFCFGWGASRWRRGDAVTSVLQSYSTRSLVTITIAVWMVGLYFAYGALERMRWIAFVPFLALIVMGGLNVLKISTSNVLFTNAPASQDKHLWWVASGTAVLIVLRDLVLKRAFAFSVFPDGIGYMVRGQRVLDFDAPYDNVLVTLPYPLMNSLTDSLHNPYMLIGLQSILGALAVAALIYIIGKEHFGLAIGLGVFFLLDLNHALLNRTVLTEGSFATFFMLSLALLTDHCSRRHQQIPRWQLVWAGVLFGWTLIFRPSALLLAPGVLVVYWWSSRRKMAWVAAGMAIFLLGHGMFFLWRTDEFTLVPSAGIYTAWPLLTYGIFSPENGPISQELDMLFSECRADVAYIQTNRAYPSMPEIHTMDIRDQVYIWQQFIPCLTSYHGELGPTEEQRLAKTSDLLRSAYSEAILSQPLAYSLVVLRELGSFAAVPIMRTWKFMPFYRMEATNPELQEFCIRNDIGWCIPGQLPTPQVSDAVEGNPLFGFWLNATTYTTQPYLLLVPHFDTPSELYASPEKDYGVGTPRYYAVSLAAWGAMVGTAYLVTRGRIRFIVVASAILIQYTAFTVVAGQVVTPRYTWPLSPFYIIIAVCTAAGLIRLWRQNG